MTGIWRPLDLMSVRDAAVADIVPKMSKLEGYSDVGGARMIYNLGHAIFEFIEAKWGKEGLRQYLFSLRKSVIGGGEDAYEEAFKITAEEFDQEFEKYLKDRFKPFRDKERPADYGRNLLPNPEKTPFRGGYTVEPSPSGDLLAIFSGNARDREGDILLVSAHDGSVVRNLTKGFDQGLGFEFIVTPGGRWVTVPWFSWSATGDRLAYFARTEKSRSLILQNVLTRDIERRVEMRTVDDPESPDFSPDGRKVAFAALQNGTGDIFVVDLQTEEVTNITKDAFADSAPTWSPDGRSIVYNARVSGNEKLFRVDVATGEKTQLTFGTHDDAAAQFLDADTLVFPSTATDPAQPIDPDVARNGQIYNVWTLSLKNGELRQYTDAVSGNLYTAVLRDGNDAPRIGVVTYYKGEYELHALDRRDPIVTAASSDFGAPGPIIDFQAPLSHTLVADKKAKKGKFERMFMDGRPPVNVGVTSSGDVFGGTAVTFSDVLGDQQFSLYAASISQYRTLSFSYLNLAHRFNYALQGYSQTQFFYGNLEDVFYDPSFSGIIDRDLSIATRTIRGGSIFGIWPLNRYRRLELVGGVLQYNENFNDPALQAYSEDYQNDQFGRAALPLGHLHPARYQLRPGDHDLPRVRSAVGEHGAGSIRDMRRRSATSLSRQTADIDARYYMRLGASGLLALRARGFRSWGDAPDFMYFGGNSEMRGYEYLQFVGDTTAFFNAELRFPLIEAMLTPIGVLGGIRGVFFANMGGGHFDGQHVQVVDEQLRALHADQRLRLDLGSDSRHRFTAHRWWSTASASWTRAPRTAWGWRRSRSASRFTSTGRGRRSSTGTGRTRLFRPYGGSDEFRKVKFSVWIGYNF